MWACACVRVICACGNPHNLVLCRDLFPGSVGKNLTVLCTTMKWIGDQEWRSTQGAGVCGTQPGAGKCYPSARAFWAMFLKYLTGNNFHCAYSLVFTDFNVGIYARASFITYTKYLLFDRETWPNPTIQYRDQFHLHADYVVQLHIVICYRWQKLNDSTTRSSQRWPEKVQ